MICLLFIELRNQATIYVTTVMRFSQVSLGVSDCVSRLRLRIKRDIHCTKKTYFKLHVEIPLGKKVTRSQKVPFWRVERFRHLRKSLSHTFPPKFDHFPIVRFG